MPGPRQHLGLEIGRVGDVTVARFAQRNLVGEDAINEVGRRLVQLVEEQGCRKLLVDFRNVERVESLLLGKLVALHRRMDAAGGRVVLAAIAPPLDQIFQALNLGALLHVYSDESAALGSF